MSDAGDPTEADTSPEDRLAEAAAEVYGTTPDGFVQRRDDLARRARDEGDRALAEAITQLRKPTLAAWAVDQLALHHSGPLEELFRAGDRARDAMGGADGPSPADAMQSVRAQVRELRELAGTQLDGIGASRRPHLDEVEETLTAAAVDPSLRSDVATGRLTQPITSTGFAALTGLALGGRPAPEPEDGNGDGRDDGHRQRREEERQRLAREVADLEQRAAEAEGRAASFRERAGRADREASALRAEQSRAEDRLARLMEDLGDPAP